MKRVALSRERHDSPLEMVIVGPCDSGNTALAYNLQRIKNNASQTSQVHSYVRSLWKKMTQLEPLINLSVSSQRVFARLLVGHSLTDEV